MFQIRMGLGFLFNYDGLSVEDVSLADNDDSIPFVQPRGYLHHAPASPPQGDRALSCRPLLFQIHDVLSLIHFLNDIVFQ